jgi:hypothetical protein
MQKNIKVTDLGHVNHPKSIIFEVVDSSSEEWLPCNDERDGISIIDVLPKLLGIDYNTMYLPLMNIVAS